MPRWRYLCKKWEEPTNLIDTPEICKVLDIKSGFGPPKLDDKGNEILDCNLNPVLQWNRCWSCIPEEWVSAIKDLINELKNKWRVETFEDDPNDSSMQIIIDQVKDKFGSLRFCYTTIGLTDEEEDQIEQMLDACEKQLAIDDPYYGEPW